MHRLCLEVDQNLEAKEGDKGPIDAHLFFPLQIDAFQIVHLHRINLFYKSFLFLIVEE